MAGVFHSHRAAYLFSLAWLLALEPWLGMVLPGLPIGQADAKMPPLPRRIPVKFDPKTPIKDLLPTPPDAAPAPLPWLVKDLSGVPEVGFQKVVRKKSALMSKDVSDLSLDLTSGDLAKMEKERTESLEAIAQVLARVNHLNKEGTDQFMKVLLRHRPDLAGLPWVMGDGCRTDKESAKLFLMEVSILQGALTRMAEADPKGERTAREQAHKFWEGYKMRLLGDISTSPITPSNAPRVPARIAATVQMLSIHTTEMRVGLVDFLKETEHPDAALALARLAVYSKEEEVRKPALAALKHFPAQQYQHVLLHSLRYPLPQVADNAAVALIALGKTDVVPHLIAFLDEPDPRAPVLKEGKHTVREVVKLNHLHNCVLCHAPGNTEDVVMRFGRPAEMVTGPVPSPNQHLFPPSMGYGDLASPDILVRVDVNYLRQDFSLMQPVKDASPWPEMQRFDYLVRVREITPGEAESYGAWVKAQGHGYRSPQHEAALRVLRALGEK